MNDETLIKILNELVEKGVLSRKGNDVLLPDEFYRVFKNYVKGAAAAAVLAAKKGEDVFEAFIDSTAILWLLHNYESLSEDELEERVGVLRTVLKIGWSEIEDKLRPHLEKLMEMVG